MFYVKTKTGEEVEIEEVYTRCPDCDAEFEVDLNDIIDNLGNLDLYGTQVYCTECSKRRMNKE